MRRRESARVNELCNSAICALCVVAGEMRCARANPIKKHSAKRRRAIQISLPFLALACGPMATCAQSALLIIRALPFRAASCIIHQCAPRNSTFVLTVRALCGQVWRSRRWLPIDYSAARACGQPARARWRTCRRASSALIRLHRLARAPSIARVRQRQREQKRKQRRVKQMKLTENFSIFELWPRARARFRFCCHVRLFRRLLTLNKIINLLQARASRTMRAHHLRIAPL